MARLLGIDYGSKRIGIAMSNETGEYALPYSVLQNSKDVLQDILSLSKEHNITQIVIGESKDFNGKDNTIMDAVRNLAQKLRDAHMEVTLHPEFLTSQQAEHIQGKNDMLDASAAAIILQSYLDEHTNMRMSK